MSEPDSQKRKKFNAQEFLKQYEKGPERIKEMEAYLWEKRDVIQAYRDAEAPLLAELTETIQPIETVGNIYRNPEWFSKTTYLRALPILLKWLPQIEHIDVKETIVRALSNKWAKKLAPPVLFQEFHRYWDDADERYSGYKWVIGNTLEALADESMFPQMAEIVTEKSQGTARQMIVLGLGKVKNPAAVDILIGLLPDEDVQGHAIAALRKLKPLKARPYLEPYTRHPNAWIRREAKGALMAIAKAHGEDSAG